VGASQEAETKDSGYARYRGNRESGQFEFAQVGKSLVFPSYPNTMLVDGSGDANIKRDQMPKVSKHRSKENLI